MVRVAGVAQVEIEQLGLEHSAGAGQHPRLHAGESGHTALLVHHHVRLLVHEHLVTWAGCSERAEIRFPIEPEGTYTAASLPSIAATSASSAITVGSSPQTSSPTSASAIARRISGVGRVTVSERKSSVRTAAAYPVAEPGSNR